MYARSSPLLVGTIFGWPADTSISYCNSLGIACDTYCDFDKKFQSFNVFVCDCDPSSTLYYLSIPWRFIFSHCSRFQISGDSSFDFNSKLSSNVLYFFLRCLLLRVLFYLLLTAIPLLALQSVTDNWPFLF